MPRFLPLLVLLASLLPAQQPAPGFVNPVKKTLKEGGIAIGGTVQAANPDTAAIMAGAGFDFLWIEGEHSPITLETTRNIILLTQGRKAVPFTRVPVNELWTAKRMLDVGSLGVIFPFTDTADLARQAVAACKYPPAGRRGYGPGMASLRWPVPEGYPKWANDNVMVIVIVERPVAIDHIEEIAAVERVMSAAKKHNIPVGGPAGAADVKRMLAEGYRFLQGPSDLSLLQSAARDFFSAIKASGVERKEPLPIY